MTKSRYDWFRQLGVARDFRYTSPWLTIHARVAGTKEKHSTVPSIAELIGLA